MSKPIKTSRELERYIARQYPELKQGLSTAIVRLVFSTIRESLITQSMAEGVEPKFSIPNFGRFRVTRLGGVIQADKAAEARRLSFRMSRKFKAVLNKRTPKAANADHID